MSDAVLEREKSVKRSSMGARYITVTGILSAAAFVLMLLEIPIPFLIPSFIKFDFSDLPALIGAFAMGPVSGIIIELIKNLLHGLIYGFSVGLLSNFVLGAMFVGVAGAVYKFDKTKKGALIASFIGAAAMAVFSYPSNVYVVYPVYYQMGFPKDTILGMYQAIIHSVKSVEQSILVFNVPFTFVKGLIDVMITFLVYKHISPILKGKY